MQRYAFFCKPPSFYYKLTLDGVGCLVLLALPVLSVPVGLSVSVVTAGSFSFASPSI